MRRTDGQRLRSPLLLLAALASSMLLLWGCGADHDPSAAKATPGNPGDDGVGPYVSVAVDNHFHDIHPENHISIAPDRAFIIKNEGSNLHNVTIVGTDISKDIKPGQRFELDPVGDTLSPGTYTITCRFHGDQGMSGEITVPPRGDDG